LLDLLKINMRKVKKVYEVFKFDELKKDIQEKVIGKMYDVNVNYEWWDNDMINEIAKDYGLEIVISEICFSLDRDYFCYFETYNHGQKKDYVKGIFIDDYNKFIKKAGLKVSKKLAENDFYIDHKHYAGSVGKNYIEGYDLSETELEKLENCLSDFIDEVLSKLKKDYDYLTSKKSIVETIKANEYEFLKNGEMF